MLVGLVRSLKFSHEEAPKRFFSIRVVLYFINRKLYNLSVYIYIDNTHRIQRLVRYITLP